MVNLLQALPPAARAPRESLAPHELGEVVEAVARREEFYRPLVRHDLYQRFHTRLHSGPHLEVWLICWEVGQDTLLHDHGGSRGAFTVVEGTLLEDYAAGPDKLLQRRVESGTTVPFGRRHVHNLVNHGAAPATSIHAYSDPLTTMSYYYFLDNGLELVRTMAVDGPDAEPVSA